jgi:TrmH family RNA methyltransferase
LGSLVIASPANPEVKAVAALHRRAEREAAGRFVIEGPAELGRAAAAGWQFETLYHVGEEAPASLAARAARVVQVSSAVYERMGFGRGGLLAVSPLPSFDLSALEIGDDPLVLVAEAIEKPGNIGAMLRTAAAAGAVVIVADPATDLTNPNVVRASLGAVFSVPVAVEEAEAVANYLKERDIPLMAAVTTGGLPPWEVDLTAAVAIAVGSEHAGLSSTVTSSAAGFLQIPTASGIDSLNSSIAAAVLIFEAVRQRSTMLGR